MKKITYKTKSGYIKKAIILGGTEDHIRLIEILKNKGYYTILIDYFENPPAKNVADKHIRESTLDVDKVTKIAKEINPELVITACIDQALLTMAYVCEKLNLPCHISYKTALELTNKANMKLKCENNDIPTSKYRTLEFNSSAKDIDLRFPVVVKPVDSNSSKGISKVCAREELDKAIEYAYSCSRIRKCIIEEFIEGDEISVDLVVREFEPKIVMVTKNVKMSQNPDNFTIVQSKYPGTTHKATLDKIINVAQKITAAFLIKNGPLLIQLIDDGNDISVIEFSSRIGGGSKHHFIKEITSFDLLEWFINLLLNEANHVHLENKWKYGCVNYIYSNNGVIGEYVGFDNLKEKKIIKEYFLYKTIGMEVRNHVSSSDRPAGYMIVDDQSDSFQSKISMAIKNLKILDLNKINMIIN